jgi:peptide/nickel transport system permease protein
MTTTTTAPPAQQPAARRHLGTWSEIVHAFRKDRLASTGLVVVAVVVLCAVFADVIAPFPPRQMNRGESGGVDALMRPGMPYLLGTNNLGNDIFSQMIHGSRTTLVVGLLAAFLTTLIGGAAGILAGYVGGRTDAFIMRLVDIAYTIPFEPFVILVLALTTPSLGTVIIAMVLLMWRQPARVIRAQVLSLRERPFVKAARVSGASSARIMLRHVGPNVTPLLLLYLALTVEGAIIAEASISFLGFGDPRLVSWGGMLQTAFASGHIRDAWWWTVPPGLSIAVLVMSFFFIGRALQAATSPARQH